MKRLFLGIILVWILVGFLFCSIRIQPVRADGTVTINADGSVTPPGAPIQRNGNLYTLTGNITSSADGIDVGRDNIILDGNGFSLQFMGTAQTAGVKLWGTINVTIRNLQIDSFDEGISIYDSISINLLQNHVAEARYGIAVDSSSNCTLSENGAIGSSVGSISVENSTGNSLSRNNLVGGRIGGIVLTNTGYNTVSENTITNATAGIDVSGTGYSEKNTLSANNLIGNQVGIRLFSSGSNTLTHNVMEQNGFGLEIEGGPLDEWIQSIDTSNTIDSKPVYYIVNETGISISPLTYPAVGYLGLINCTAANIEGLNLTGEQGFLLAYTNNSKIQNDNIANSMYGVRLEYSNNITLSENNIVNNNQSGYGVMLDYSNNITLSENNIVSNGCGIFALGTSNDSVEDCAIADNSMGIFLGNYFNILPVTVPYFGGLVNGSHNCICGDNLTGNQESIWLSYASDNLITQNEVTNARGYGLYMVEAESNRIVGNDIKANPTGLFLESSCNNVISENNISQCGIGLQAFYSSNDNTINHNNFFDNSQQANLTQSIEVWDNGYPFGGNCWSDYARPDVMKGQFQNETGSDGIGDTPYTIDANNTDNYPLMLSVNQTRETDIVISSFAVLSGSVFGSVPVATQYTNLGDAIYPLVCVPANRSTTLSFDGWFSDYMANPLGGKEVKLLMDDALVSSGLSGNQSSNLNGSVNINLSAGMHQGELEFLGDQQYDASVFRFSVLAYVDSGFNVTKDAYSFSNWGFSLDEYAALGERFINESMLDQALDVPFLMLYPLATLGGHCFGMAGSSSAYYLDPSLKPEPSNDTYSFSIADVAWDIDWYHISQLAWLSNATSIASSLNKTEALIDSGTPVILGMKTIHHAVTIIGYYENANETFLVVYDNTMPNSTYVCTVKNGTLTYGSSIMSSAVFIDPHDLPKEVNVTELLIELFKQYVGLQFHSPVDINITSTSGKTLLIENNTVIVNDFDDSYIYMGDSKIILLPSAENCTLEGTGTDSGQVSLDCVFTSNAGIIVHQSQNITISNGSKLYLDPLQSGTLYVDSNGDGIIDQTITIPEFPSFMFLSLLILLTLFAAIIFRRKRTELVLGSSK